MLIMFFFVLLCFYLPKTKNIHNQKQYQIYYICIFFIYQTQLLAFFCLFFARASLAGLIILFNTYSDEQIANQSKKNVNFKENIIFLIALLMI